MNCTVSSLDTGIGDTCIGIDLTSLKSIGIDLHLIWSIGIDLQKLKHHARLGLQIINYFKGQHQVSRFHQLKIAEL